MRKSKLFRQEAIDFQSKRWVGKALLLSRIPTWIVVSLSLFFIAVFIVYISTASYSRRIKVPGEIITTPKAVTIYSPTQGYIKRVFFNVGDEVNRNEHLFEIDSSQETTSGSVGEETLDSINKQIVQIRTIIDKLTHNREENEKSIKKQIAKFNDSLEEINRFLEVSKDNLTGIKKTTREYERYHGQGLITQDQLTNQQYIYYQQQNLYNSLNNQKDQLIVQLNQLNTDLITKIADIENKISEYQYQLSDLERNKIETTAVNTIVVTSKITGKIQSRLAEEGEMVKSGAPIVQITPNSESVKYYFVLWVTDSTLPYLKLNDEVNISYSAFPVDKFGLFRGNIAQISYAPASKEEIYEKVAAEQNQPANNQNYYKVVLKIPETSISDKGNQLQLSEGLKGTAILYLEKRKLYQWMVAPIYEIKSSITRN